jgi:hypothetical protein
MILVEGEVSGRAVRDIRSGYLAKLTAHEKGREKRLTARLGGLYSPRSDWRNCFEGDQKFRSLGGFENSWTLAPQDMPLAN